MPSLITLTKNFGSCEVSKNALSDASTDKNTQKKTFDNVHLHSVESINSIISCIIVTICCVF